MTLNDNMKGSFEVVWQERTLIRNQFCSGMNLRVEVVVVEEMIGLQILTEFNGRIVTHVGSTSYWWGGDK
jgi:hypothetical protein